MGTIKAICISDKRGIQKTEIKEAVLVPDFGIEGDAHGGKWHRQVSLLSYEKVEEFKAKGADIVPGAFGENLVVEGYDFRTLPVGSRFICGDVVLEMTQIGKECHTHCQIYHKMGDCIMPREGVFAEVIKGGTIAVGDEMRLELPDPKRPYRAAVVTLSDKGAKGEREDKSGPALKEILEQAGYHVIETLILPDEQKRIEIELIRLSDGRAADLILTTGGTGFSMRDCTPEATLAVATRNAPGIAEAIRNYSMQYTKRAMLSRGASVIRNQTLIVNLPGSPKAVKESMECIMDQLSHGLGILTGREAECAR
ncbi:MAG: molybdopterin-binding protein [Lachnospiraceae bacterium]|nr:molybdopterin-binding protein [Lachnospiraceae bacterium]